MLGFVIALSFVDCATCLAFYKRQSPMAVRVHLCTFCLHLPTTREPKENCHHVSAHLVLVCSVSICCLLLNVPGNMIDRGILGGFSSFQVSHNILKDHSSLCGKTDRILHYHCTNAWDFRLKLYHLWDKISIMFSWIIMWFRLECIKCFYTCSLRNFYIGLWNRDTNQTFSESR